MESKQSNKAYNIRKRIEVGQIILFVALSILCFYINGTKEYIINSGVIILISESMALLFRYVANSESYDLLAGVDTSKKKYDFDRLRKFVETIEFVFAFNGLIISSLIMLISLVGVIGLDEKKMVVFILTNVYGLCCAVPIVVLSYRQDF